MERFELLSEMRSGRKRLKQALDKVDPAKMTAPLLDGGWSVKDVLAHLAFWERRTIIIYRAIKNGREPQPPLKDLDIDDINAGVYEEYHDWPLDRVAREEEAAYQELLEIADTAPEEDLFSPYRFEMTNDRPFYEWIAGNSYDHFDEHIAMLETSAEFLRRPTPE